MVAERAGDTGQGAQPVPSEGWDVDSIAERYVASLGVRWTYLPGLSISKLDRGASLQNNARRGAPIDPILVEQYAEAMRLGARFPAPWVHRQANGLYVVDSGNHRMEASFRSRRHQIDVYVLEDTTPGLLRLLRVNLNGLVGYRPARADFVVQAIEWHDRYGGSIRDAAAHFAIPEAQLQQAVRERDSLLRYKKLGIDDSGLSARHRTRIAALPLNGTVAALTELQVRAKLPEAELSEVIAAVRAEGTEAGQVHTIEAYAARPDVRSRIAANEGGIGRRAGQRAEYRVALFRSLKMALGLVEKHPTRSQLQLTDAEDHQRALVLARKVAQALAYLDE